MICMADTSIARADALRSRRVVYVREDFPSHIKGRVERDTNYAHYIPLVGTMVSLGKTVDLSYCEESDPEVEVPLFARSIDELLEQGTNEDLETNDYKVEVFYHHPYRDFNKAIDMTKDNSWIWHYATMAEIPMAEEMLLKPALLVYDKTLIQCLDSPEQHSFLARLPKSREELRRLVLKMYINMKPVNVDPVDEHWFF